MGDFNQLCDDPNLKVGSTYSIYKDPCLAVLAEARMSGYAKGLLLKYVE